LQFINVEGTDESAVVQPHNLPVRLCVFLPDGNRGRMFVKGGYPAKLWWDRPHEKIKEMSEAVLKCRGRIEDGG
jgi:hypothetical protein